MDFSAWQPYWEGEHCVAAWELMCFPANVHLKNNNFTSHEDHPWSHRGCGQKARPTSFLSCSFLCAPINTSPICIETICIFGKISKCWHKCTIYTPTPPFNCPLPSLRESFPSCWTFHCLRQGEREREREKDIEMKGDLERKNVSQRPPCSLSHYGIHQNPRIHSTFKALLSHKGGLAKLGVFVDWRVGLSLV